MNQINQRINGFSVRQKELEKRIIEMNERLKDTLNVRSGEQQQIITKIDSFSETVSDVNMRTANLEKAFKETLPALIESVRALSDLVVRIKREA
jgi:predicted transcriptional regulator